MKNYFKFLLVSYLVALLFESLANTIGDGKLFQNLGWPIFFVFWYGFMYSILYLFFRNKKLWQGVVFFALLGNLVEVLVFHRSNLFIDSIIYALMGLLPLWFLKRSWGREAMTR
jgi:hypothetical protein